MGLPGEGKNPTQPGNDGYQREIGRNIGLALNIITPTGPTNIYKVHAYNIDPWVQKTTDTGKCLPWVTRSNKGKAQAKDDYAAATHFPPIKSRQGILQ